VLYVASLGIALYLLLPLLPGLEQAALGLSRASKPLLVTVLAVEVLSLLCYSELLARSVVASSKMRPSLARRRRAGIGPWFTFRLAVCGLGAGRVLPGGGAVLAAIALGALGKRGLKAADVSAALAVSFTLVYGALCVLCVAAFGYLVAARDIPTAVAVAVLAIPVLLVMVALAARSGYRRSARVRRPFVELAHEAERFLGRGRLLETAAERAKRFAADLRSTLKGAGGQLLERPSRLTKLSALAFGYWFLDALCLFLVFAALGTEVELWKLIVTYAVAQLVAVLPFMPPGGLGVAEGVFVSLFALLGVGPETSLYPVLGYRLFNYWMPILLAAIFYPTLRFGAKQARERKVR
jgi:uncharacterized protein (TIRG00374 family)